MNMCSNKRNRSSKLTIKARSYIKTLTKRIPSWIRVSNRHAVGTGRSGGAYSSLVSCDISHHACRARLIPCSRSTHHRHRCRRCCRCCGSEQELRSLIPLDVRRGRCMATEGHWERRQCISARPRRLDNGPNLNFSNVIDQGCRCAMVFLLLHIGRHIFLSSLVIFGKDQQILSF